MRLHLLTSTSRTFDTDDSPEKVRRNASDQCYLLLSSELKPATIGCACHLPVKCRQEVASGLRGNRPEAGQRPVACPNELTTRRHRQRCAWANCRAASDVDALRQRLAAS